MLPTPITILPTLLFAQAEPAAESGGSFFDILLAGGPVGLLVLLLSIAAAALVIEHFLSIRAAVLSPPGLADEVGRLIASGQLKPADERCKATPSFLSFVLRAGLAEVDGGWPAIEKGMEDAAADQAARLFRKIEYLSVIGNIAPMLGLLGTVIGMIFAFREVADTQGAARAADLAEGIYLALVTTVEGLIVAIPALGFFAIFRNRVDHLVAETSYEAMRAVRPLKRPRAAAQVTAQAAVQARRGSSSSPPPIGGKG